LTKNNIEDILEEEINQIFEYDSDLNDLKNEESKNINIIYYRNFKKNIYYISL
jgi:hypothetical protein